MSRVIGCERPTRLDRLRDDRPRPGGDALIEVAALVTDSDLNVLGDGIDLVIAPPAGALEQMGDFVRDMHTGSGLLDELDAGITLADAEQQVLDYITEYVPEPRQGRRWPATPSAPTASFLARDMPELEAHLHYRIVDVSSIKELVPPLVPAGLLRAAGQERQPPRARRHPGEHRGAALLPRGRVRAPARSGLIRGQADRAPSHQGAPTGSKPGSEPA